MASSSEQLASLLWAEMKASGLTQAAIADLVGISQKHISRVMGGHNGMSLDLVDRILAEIGRDLVLSTRVHVEPAPLHVEGGNGGEAA